MTCKAEVRLVKGAAIVDLSGRITVADGAGIIRDAVRDLTERGHKHILINLVGVQYLDSAAGLGELVGCYVALHNRGGELKLLNPCKTVQELLRLTKLDTVFELFRNEDEAVRSFRAPRVSGAAG